LLVRVSVPLLLISATCWPEAVRAIKKVSRWMIWNLSC
jgi:hypothetical protein